MASHPPDPSEVKACLKKEAAVVEQWLKDCLHHEGIPAGLRTAMEYSLMSGGKRVRPVLCILSARLFNLATESVLPFAGALECIHTYSLIHDDLPAMDNDDLRRGKPTSHKQFDEATAILAGDGLLTDAFAFMASVGASSGIPAGQVLRALQLVAEAAGSPGMVGGQFLDMQYTAQSGVSVAELSAMHAMKTGALLRVSCVAGAILAGADRSAVAAMAAYGAAIGAAFQITDDILDETGTEQELGKPVGRDIALKKTTYPSLLGLEESRRLASERTLEAITALQGFQGDTANLLRGLALYIVSRAS